ncbi:MAG: hypothetical protein KGI71_04855 [Patescibacteria group bacterium]|nr:hypothetical protein [Patescibacteria group bacterium]
MAATKKNGRIETKLPDAVRLKIRRRGRMCEFVYEEDFLKQTKVVKKGVSETVELLVRNLDSRVRVDLINKGRTIRLSGKVDSETVGDMMFGEFSCWSTASSMSLREVMVLAIVAKTARMKHHREAR